MRSRIARSTDLRYRGPCAQERRQPRAARSPAAGTPGGAILQPPREWGLWVRRTSVGAHRPEAMLRCFARDDVPVVLVDVQDRDVAEPEPLNSSERCGNQLPANVVSLIFES